MTNSYITFPINGHLFLLEENTVGLRAEIGPNESCIRVPVHVAPRLHHCLPWQRYSDRVFVNQENSALPNLTLTLTLI